MDIEIFRLSSERADDFIRFFDNTPHSDGVQENRCYCVCWCSDEYTDQDFSTADKRRAIASQYVRDGIIQGYLAYAGGKAVGWCNANTKADCLQCESWKRFMGSVPVDEVAQGIRVKSVFCFTVAPERKRKEVASRLLERVCRDAAQDGFECIEAYPNKVFVDDEEDFMGPLALFQKFGFVIHAETENKYVMRKSLI